MEVARTTWCHQVWQMQVKNNHFMGWTVAARWVGGPGVKDVKGSSCVAPLIEKLTNGMSPTLWAAKPQSDSFPLWFAVWESLLSWCGGGNSSFDLGPPDFTVTMFSNHLIEALQAPSLNQGDFSNSIFFEKSCEILKICSLDSDRWVLGIIPISPWRWGRLFSLLKLETKMWDFMTS